MAVAKSGWVLRQSSFLKTWKRAWLVLYLDGDLKYYESETSTNAEDVIVMKRDCLSVKTGNECVNVTLPAKTNVDCLFLILARNDKSWQLCGDSSDDMKAWQFALEQARVTNVGTDHAQFYPTMPVGQMQHYSTIPMNTSVRYVYPSIYYGQSHYGAHPAPYVVNTPGGHTTVIYQDQPYSRYGGSDMVFGMLAGAALGTMLWGPCLWW